jgi:hypothetical protein
MGNSTTLAQMRLRARQRADMENTKFVSDSEINTYINDGLSELNDIFITKYEEYVVSAAGPLQLTAGQESYSLSGDFGIFNFMKILGIDLNTGGRTIPMKRFMFSERDYWTIPNAPWNISVVPYRYSVRGEEIFFFPKSGVAGTITIWYIPQFCKLETDTDAICNFLPYLNNGWEEYAVITAAIKCLQKEESDTGPLMQEKGIQLGRIEGVAQNRDVGDPGRIAYVSSGHSEWWW